MNEEELRQYITAKRNPISSCVDLSKYFIGRHIINPVYLTPKFEIEFNSKMHEIEDLKEQQKEFIEYLENEIKNSDICDVYVRGMKFNSAEKMIYKDILSKYKEIIGVKDE